MKLKLATAPEKADRDLVIAFFGKEDVEGHVFFRRLSDSDRNYVRAALGRERSFGEAYLKTLYFPSGGGRAVLLGLGERKQWGSRPADRSARRAVLALKDLRSARAAMFLGDFLAPDLSPEESLRRMTENICMADFAFTSYKERPKDGWPRVGTISIVAPRLTPGLHRALREGVVVGEEVNHCRILANTPASDMTPQKLAAAASREKEKSRGRLNVRAMQEAAIKRLGMGGILGVSKGSNARPRFIIMEYRGSRRSAKPLVFVGKGVTFDSGGLNIKSETSMEGMHLDMSGGAAVIHGISAIARLGMKVNLVGLVPAVENMPSGSSFRPGDILKTITGKTVEVLNTDAEGRIILADALGYAARYRPSLVVDIATLTGSAMVALGQRLTALLTQDRQLEDLARDAGAHSGDEVWPLPLWDEYAEEIKGTFGDVANAGKTRYGGAITAGIFLKQFIGNYPWIHLDIAPTMTTIEGQHLAKGASGVGVRFLVELARRYAKGR